MNLKLWIPAIVALGLVLGACRNNPVYTISGAPVTTSTRNYSMGDVRGAILQAGASLGWQMSIIRPGLVIGTLRVREHMAKVEIPYDRHTYSILYRDSDNLDYDGANIHSNYNGWIQNLSREINTRLSQL
ncbi:MAG: hypothetical protein JNM60_03710 [Candidatus Competibacteraceae bacterium]|nr:hypothetical protein [Candidatus Competibacteraceae bacterium]MBL8258904.1 hypothetical protein [Candidatus Competibacteraceae bacterium]